MTCYFLCEDPPPQPEYTNGICSIDVTEQRVCNPPDSDLFGVITILDFDDNVLCNGSNQRCSINNNNPCTMNCQLPNPITITGEHEGDYVQFTYGSISWRSTDNQQGGPGWCNTGEWDNSQLHCPDGQSVSF